MYSFCFTLAKNSTASNLSIAYTKPNNNNNQTHFLHSEFLPILLLLFCSFSYSSCAIILLKRLLYLIVCSKLPGGIYVFCRSQRPFFPLHFFSPAIFLALLLALLLLLFLLLARSLLLLCSRSLLLTTTRLSFMCNFHMESQWRKNDCAH